MARATLAPLWRWESCGVKEGPSSPDPTPRAGMARGSPHSLPSAVLATSHRSQPVSAHGSEEAGEIQPPVTQASGFACNSLTNPRLLCQL